MEQRTKSQVTPAAVKRWVHTVTHTTITQDAVAYLQEHARRMGWSEDDIQQITQETRRSLN